MPKTYRVMNPRKHKRGGILKTEDGRSYDEGDEYTPGAGQDVKALIAKGVLRELRPRRSGRGRGRSNG